MMNKKPLGVYVHIPFCKKKCAYCDFASFAGCEEKFDAYFNALANEIDAWAEKLRAYQARSIFFGGGTPSIPPAEKIAAVIAQLRSHLDFAPDIEITLEANPGTLTPEKLAIYKSAGVNRISIGVQSFDAAILRNIGRIHNPDEAEEAVRMAESAGFDNVSIDLMYALPGQDMRIWSATLDRALSLPIAHISAYSLIVEPGTEMEKRVNSGVVTVADDDTVNEMQRLAIHKLEKAGFMRYEVSNFSKPGMESRHNMIYWTLGEYLGLGSAAHSMMENMRFANPPELERYIAGERMLNKEVRSLSDQKEEMLMLATRTLRGLDLAAWQRDFGEDFLKKHRRTIEKFETYGLIEVKKGFLSLTTMGLELQDSVVLELMD